MKARHKAHERTNFNKEKNTRLKNICKTEVGKRWLKQMETNPSRLPKRAISVSLYSENNDSHMATFQITKTDTSATLKQPCHLIQNTHFNFAS